MEQIKDPNFIPRLQILLTDECKLHTEYISVLEQEQKALTSFKQDEVVALTERREVLCDQMVVLQEKRRDFLKKYPGADQVKLSELIVKYCAPEDAKKISPLVQKLKGLVRQSQKLGREYNQVVDFSLTLINGTLSILWSATQNITQSYSRRGMIRERYQSLKNDILKQA